MTIRPRILAGLVCAAYLLLAGCAMPHMMGLGSYYAVTDEATGRTYYTDNLAREARGVVEFTDRATGATISLAAARVREISKSEYRKGGSQ